MCVPVYVSDMNISIFRHMVNGTINSVYHRIQ